jgi:hypothetical protein
MSRVKALFDTELSNVNVYLIIYNMFKSVPTKSPVLAG